MEPPTPFYFIGPKQISSSHDSNKVLDVVDASYKRGAKVQIYQNNKTLNQKFFIERVGYAEYVIRAAHSNLVLGIEGGNLDLMDSQFLNRRVVQLPQNNENNQKWILEDARNGYFFIRSCLGWYLDVADGNMTNGNSVNLHQFNGSKAQQFKII